MRSWQSKTEEKSSPSFRHARSPGNQRPILQTLSRGVLGGSLGLFSKYRSCKENASVLFQWNRFWFLKGIWMLPEKQLLMKNINNNSTQEGSGNDRPCQNINVYYFFSPNCPLHLNSCTGSRMPNETSVLSGSGIVQNQTRWCLPVIISTCDSTKAWETI